MENTRFIKVCKWYMICSGLWKFDDKNQNLIHKAYVWYGKAIQSFYVLFLISLVIHLVQIIQKNAPAERISSGVAVILIVVDIVVKIIIYQVNDIPNLFKYVTEMEKRVWTSENLNILNYYTKQISNCKVVSLCLAFASNLAVMSFGIMDYVKQVKGIEDIDDFYYEMWIPIDKEQHKAFIYGLNIFAGLASTTFNGTIRIVLVTLTMFASSQLHILQIRIRTFTVEVDSNKKLYFIRDLILQHQFLIWFVKTLNESIKYVMLMEFLLNSINMAAILFQLITMRTFEEVAFPAFYFSYLFQQVFALAYVSNEIKLQSLKIADAIYESPWYEQDEVSKKLLYIMLMRAQKPLTLTIGPFNPMTTESAFLTVKAAYSYVTLMVKSYGTKSPQV